MIAVYKLIVTNHYCKDQEIADFSITELGIRMYFKPFLNEKIDEDSVRLMNQHCIRNLKI